MTYRAPVSDILFSMVHEAGMEPDRKDGIYAGLGDGFAEATLNEAGKFAEAVLAPLNRAGDKEGAKSEAGKVTAPQGFANAYRQWAAGGCNAITGPVDFGGSDLPVLLNTACIEIWSAANVAFSICPLLTLGAIEAMEAQATETLKNLYLAQLVSGEWTGTMNLTEPQAGSDLGALKTRAERQPDGTYKIFGSKIFITMASTTWPTTSSISCSRVCPMRQTAHAAFRFFWFRNFSSMPMACLGPATIFFAPLWNTSSASMPHRPAPWSMAIMAVP